MGLESRRTGCTFVHVRARSCVRVFLRRPGERKVRSSVEGLANERIFRSSGVVPLGRTNSSSFEPGATNTFFVYVRLAPTNVHEKTFVAPGWTNELFVRPIDPSPDERTVRSSAAFSSDERTVRSSACLRRTNVLFVRPRAFSSDERTVRSSVGRTKNGRTNVQDVTNGRTNVQETKTDERTYRRPKRTNERT